GIARDPERAQQSHVGVAREKIHAGRREVENTPSVRAGSNSRYRRALPEQRGRIGAVPFVHCGIERRDGRAVQGELEVSQLPGDGRREGLSDVLGLQTTSPSAKGAEGIT